ncbi:hypothetical protein E3N88_16418 [Mikania micrantha]|uniref:Aminotransferase-like plant mobile domain-containing protein n=1 Tax=Mikania micrantha TaxID=192012 RepID=A0A5N6NZM0_9ASTR|nr:hypothetical protein E3N88_16418 [Mikania micrantha]
MSYDLHPGPIVDDVLFLKDSHRARDIFNNREVPKLVFRRADQKFFSFLSNNPITDNVKRYIDIAGFGGVIDSGYRNLDHGLLEALIERWREVVSGCEQPSSLADRIVRCHTLLEDLTACGHLSWGSAVLAMLYRNLCKAASNNSTNIGGPLYILQLWAWSRITTLAPTILHEFDNRRPYGAMSGIRSWQSECFLIYWDVVEFHTPQRVMRQFGMVQRIPDPIPLSFNEHMKLHTLIRTGKPDKNWPNIHSQFLSVWNQRWENVVQGVRCAAPTMDGISQTYQQAGQFMHTESTLNFQNFETLQNTANQVMGMLNEESRLRYPSHLHTGPVNLGVDDTVPRNLRRRERRRGNVRSGAGTSSAQHQNYQAGTSNVEHENFEAGTSHVQHENYELDHSQFSNAPSPSFFSGINKNMMFEHNNEQEVYTPQTSMLPLFTQPESENFNYYAPQFSPNYAHGFSGISPLPALDLNLHMSVGDLDDETFLANTLNAEDVDVD